MTEEIQIAFELDDKGMVGRQCPATDCERYFKLKPGTGLNSDVTRCPYCGNKSPSGDFLTTIKGSTRFLWQPERSPDL